MNTATCITRFTMIAAALAAAVTVQAAPPVAQGASAKVIDLPMVTVTGKRATQADVVVAQVVQMPMITVTGKRPAEAGPVLVAHKAVGAMAVKASRV